MANQFSVPRGTNDILPSQVPLWQEIETKTREILATYNYQEIRTPIFEETELFARSMGQTSDVVQKQMLNLASQKKDSTEENSLSGLSLRPENTASVVRAYIEHSFDKKESLSKLFYIGPMFRGERPQKGRLRQFHQIGVEAIGPNTSSPYLDAEVIALSVHILQNLGIKGFVLKINTLGSSDDKENFGKLLRQLLQSSLKDLCEDCQSRFERNVLRILDCKNKACKEIVAKISLGDSYLSQESKTYFEDLKKALNILGIKYEVSPHLVRGLDYYTHTVFEISHSDLGSQDALGAGGRYNSLVSQLGGPQVDAIGFALGIERILLAMPTNEVKVDSPTAFIITMDETSLPKAFEILNDLRLNGISSDMSYRLSSMKSQMRLADKVGAKYVLILGENEMKEKVVTLKNMQSGEQTKVEWERIIEFLK